MGVVEEAVEGALFENTPDACELASTDGTSVVNPAHAERLGDAPVDTQPVAAARAAALTGVRTEIPLHVIERRGLRIAIAGVAVPLPATPDTPARALVILREYAPARRADEAWLRLALDANRMVAWERDHATGGMTIVGSALTDLGVEPGHHAHPPRLLAGRLHPDDRARHAGLAAEPDNCATRFRVLDASGAMRWLERRSQHVTDAAGVVVGARGLTIDVTAQVESERRLRESRAEWQALVEHAPDVIIHLDREGTIRFINHPPEGDAQALLGRSWRELLPEARRAEQEEAFAAALRGETRTAEVERAGADGALEWYQLHAGPVRRDGQVTGVIVVARDITARKQAEAQLIVSDRMASVGTLAAGVAHEINNPLAAAMANVELAARQASELARRLPVPEDLLEELHDAREAVERVRQIVRDLRMFSRAEEDRRGPVDVRRVLESTLRMAWNEIRHRARLVKEYGDVPAVIANESRLGQVFLNLIVNAAQAIPEGAAERNTIRVVSAVDADGRVVIVVGDTGRGIPPEVRARLFTPFFTTKAPGVGTGLGLSICHRIVTGLGGTITFDSVPGRGTEFRVVLPAADAPCVDAQPAAGTTAPTRRGRILVVDDEAIVTRSLQRALAIDHEVTAFTSARQALDAIRAGAHFDAVVCDLMMPTMTGMDLHAALSLEAPDQAARMVFLTGGAFTPRAREFLDAVPNRRLEKPFDPQGLRVLLADVVR